MQTCAKRAASGNWDLDSKLGVQLISSDIRYTKGLFWVESLDVRNSKTFGGVGSVGRSDSVVSCVLTWCPDTGAVYVHNKLAEMGRCCLSVVDTLRSSAGSRSKLLVLILSCG